MKYKVTPNGYKDLNINVLDMGSGQERYPWLTSGQSLSYEFQHSYFVLGFDNAKQYRPLVLAHQQEYLHNLACARMLAVLQQQSHPEDGRIILLSIIPESAAIQLQRRLIDQVHREDCTTQTLWSRLAG